MPLTPTNCDSFDPFFITRCRHKTESFALAEQSEQRVNRLTIKTKPNYANALDHLDANHIEIQIQVPQG